MAVVAAGILGQYLPQVPLAVNRPTEQFVQSVAQAYE
jgi:hypothetical protein